MPTSTTSVTSGRKRAALAAAAVAALLLLLVAAPATAAATTAGDYVPLATADGRRQIRSSDYINGLNTGTSEEEVGNKIIPCGQFADFGSDFVIRVTMGSFSDHFVPSRPGVSVCDLLTSTAAADKYRYASSDPTASGWDGYSSMVGLSSQWPTALGGAPFNYLSSTTFLGTAERATVSFWGFDDDDDDNGNDGGDASHKGGCCAHTSHETASWLQAFSISIAPMQADKLYLVTMTKAATMVAGAPIVLLARVWNFRGTAYTQPMEFDIDLNGLRTVRKKSSHPAQANLMFEYTPTADELPAIGEDFILTITGAASGSVAPPTLSEGARSLRLEFRVASPDTAQLTPCLSSRGISTMLHYGAGDFAIGPVSRFSAFDNDWFAAASAVTSGAAGEGFLRPVEGHPAVAMADPSLPATTQRWTEVTSKDSDGTFYSTHLLASMPTLSGNVDAAANGTLQFLAFMLHSAADQGVLFKIAAGEVVAVFVDSEEVEPPSGSTTMATLTLDNDENSPAGTEVAVGRVMFPYFLSKGYHQVIVKLFSSTTVTGDPSRAVTALNFKVIGTGVGYALDTPLTIPTGAYLMESDKYMYSMMHSGGADPSAMLYAKTIDEDLVGVQSARPRALDTVVVGSNSKNTAAVWNMAVFYGGTIPISGADMPTDGSSHYAVKYVTLALFNQYDADFDVQWQLMVRGHTEMYLNGVMQYSAPADAEAEAFVTTRLSPGWHQLMVRLAAPRDTTWVFRFYLRLVDTGARLLGSTHIMDAAGMPFGLRAVASAVPVQAMLELTATEFPVGADKFAAMITYDASDDVASLPEYLSPGISAVTGGAARPFFAYAAETLTIASALPSNRGTVKLPYEWVPTTKLQDGVWGSVAEDRLAGGYYRLWAFNLYAVTAGTATARVEYIGGIAIWVDGRLAGSYPPKSGKNGGARQVSISIALEQGWNQVLLKLQVPSTFNLRQQSEFEEGEGGDNDAWSSWFDIASQCQRMNTIGRGAASYKACPSQAYCPFGSPRVGTSAGGLSLPLPLNDPTNTYAAVADGEGLFIQLGGAATGAAPLCSTKSVTLDGGAVDISKHGAGRYIACCRVVRPPSLSLAFVLPEEMTGQVGYTYQELVTIGSPKIQTDRAYLSEQTVAITSATAGAKIRYRVAQTNGLNPNPGTDVTDWIEYTAPLTVTKSSVVEAHAYLGVRVSGTVNVVVTVPDVITYTRRTCLFNHPCSMTFSGVRPSGGRVALASTALLTAKELQAHVDLTYADKQPVNEAFSGTAPIKTRTFTATVTVPRKTTTATGSSTYAMIVYDGPTGTKGTQEGYITMHDDLALAPRAVVATADAVFQTNVLVLNTDTVIFPAMHNATAAALCDWDACNRVFSAYGAKHGSPVSASGSFRADLTRATAVESLTCLCVCTSCRTRLASGAFTAGLTMSRGRITAIPVSIAVYQPTGPTATTASTTMPTPTVTPRPPPPPKDEKGNLVFIILVPILVIAAAVITGVVAFVRIRRKRAAARKAEVSIGGHDADANETGSAAAVYPMRGRMGGMPPGDGAGGGGVPAVARMSIAVPVPPTASGAASFSPVSTALKGLPVRGESSTAGKDLPSYPTSPAAQRR